MFDRICHDNGIRHLLTAPYSPTTTGKVERLHKTMRREFFTPKDRMFATIGELQAALDGWVTEYNTARPHQACGRRPPAERFRLASRSLAADTTAAAQPAPARPPADSTILRNRLVIVSGYTGRPSSQQNSHPESSYPEPNSARSRLSISTCERSSVRVSGSRTIAERLPALATALAEAVEEAENVISHRLPPLLIRLYLEAGNGGFGPGHGVNLEP